MHCIMIMSDQRRHRRLKKSFPVTLRKRIAVGPDVFLQGNTLDLSQSGAFIKTESWHLFKPNELTELTLLLPPDFTGRDTPLGLQGSAFVRRVDQLRGGIALEFTDELKQFQPIPMC